MAAAKLAALITLLVLLGPVACQNYDHNGSHGSRRHRGRSVDCLGGWVRLFNGGKCPPGSKHNPNPRPSPPPYAPSLNEGYYKSCPNAEKIVRDVVYRATYNDRGVGAGLIRLFFHDCFVQGCDASVLLTSTPESGTQTEMVGAPNINSLRASAFKVIDDAKAELEKACPNSVSCADIVAFAARDASDILSGGRIKFPMPAGRYDGRVSRKSEAESDLPGPSENIQQLTASFRAKGLSPTDLVVLSGAHSIGNARCLFFTDRLSEMDPGFAAGLNRSCTSDDTRVNQDYKTPDVLDKQYYQNIIDKKVLFTSDDTLKSSSLVGDFASNPVSWEAAFAKSMVEMGKIGVKTSANGEIRKTCSRIN
ncbi:hypothetical protein ACP70R_005291 [Stipagrostis hirtigluma subsp. patula]